MTATVANLSPGCNEVVPSLNLGQGIPVPTIVGLVQPAGIIISIWQYNNPLHAYLALYFSDSAAPTDASAAGPFQSIFICTSNSGIFGTGTAQTTSTLSCPAGFVLTGNQCVQTTTNSGCPVGFVLTTAGCLPFGTSGCPAGSVLTTGGCFPIGGGCPPGFVVVPGGCLPAGTGGGGCPPGFVLTTGGCLPANGSAGLCPIGFFFNPALNACTQ